MNKLALPESIKIARVGLTSVSTRVGQPFPIVLGQKEVIILLSFYWNVIISPAAGVNLVYLNLWRKTDTNPAAIVTEHTDSIWGVRCQQHFTTESTESSWNEHVILPYPLVLIRAPRLIAQAVVAGAVSIEMRLYYLIQTVTDEEMAKLMVKDHA